MNTLISHTLCNAHLLNLNITKTSFILHSHKCRYKRLIKLYASSSSSNEQQLNTNTVEELKKEASGGGKIQEDDESKGATQVLTSAIDKDLKKVWPFFYFFKFTEKLKFVYKWVVRKPILHVHLILPKEA